MNKKKLVLPVAILTLSTVAAVIMLLFTTSFAYCFAFNRNISAVKAVYFTDKAYEIEPNYSNRTSKSMTYDVQTVIGSLMVYFDQNNDYSKDAFNKALSKYPDEYMQEVVNLSKYNYENIESTKELLEVQNNFSSNFSLPILIVPGTEKTVYAAQYALALYINGDKEESQKIIEQMMKENKKSGAFLSNYVLLVHYVETDKDFQNWMLKIEKKATENIREINPETPYTDYYRDIFGPSYKPF